MFDYTRQKFCFGTDWWDEPLAVPWNFPWLGGIAPVLVGGRDAPAVIDDCLLLDVVDMKHCDPNADLTSRYLWCQRRLADADSFRDFDSVSAVERCRHNQCCLLADRLCAASIVPPGTVADTLAALCLP